MRSSILFTSIASSLLLSLTASGAKLKVPGQYPTVQLAVDAAGPGDVVLISKGTYHEQVTVVGKSDLVLRGKGKVVIDGDGAPYVILVDSSDAIVIEGLTLRDADVGVQGDKCDGLGLKKLTIRDTAGEGVIFISCAGGEVRNSKLKNTGLDGVRIIESTSCRVEATRIEGAGGDGISMSGVGHTVLGCRIVDSADRGISVGVGGDVTESALVSGNRINGTGLDGILVTHGSSACSIVGNTVRNAGNDGIDLIPGIGSVLVHDNKIAGPAASGINLRAAGIVLDGNRVKKAGVTGILVAPTGTGNVLNENRVTKSQVHGVNVFGTSNAFFANVVKKSITGFDLKDMTLPGDNTFSANTFGTTD